MRRSSMSAKIMKCLCTLFKKASMDREKGIKRWKYKEKFTKIFCTRYMAEKIIQREWRWGKIKFYLQWWNPVVGCEDSNQKANSTWIRALGVPLILWSLRIFTEIANLCGGWVKTEEETSSKNHLKWARITIRADGKN
uniref:Uncharacterized protein n=1 Tax=Solanum lycopersicum TaxID=4081 RepID=A0A3Q7HK44_SOLLC